MPYYCIAYWTIEGLDAAQRNPSYERLFVAIQLYCLGVVFMVLTDAQKYLVLREKRGLITHGMNGWSRNMNYLGEMMLYSSFAVLCQRTEPWLIYAYVWSCVFASRILVKDYSLSKKLGWPEYKASTWILLPKLFSSAKLSVIIYSLAAALTYHVYSQGGIEATAKTYL